MIKWTKIKIKKTKKNNLESESESQESSELSSEYESYNSTENNSENENLTIDKIRKKVNLEKEAIDKKKKNKPYDSQNLTILASSSRQKK